MSKEEVIKKINEIRKEYSTMDGLTEYVEAIDMILSQVNEQQKEIERIKSLDIYKLTEEWETGQLIHKDKIREFIKEELPDDEIMKWNIIYDVNGIDLRIKLEKLLEEN